MALLRHRELPIFPQTTSNHCSLHHALKFKVCSESFLYTPKSAIIDGIISYGGSTGIGLKLPAKTYGEFYERNHLFTQVPIHKYLSLKDINPPSYREKLLDLCLLKNHNAQSCLDHAFAFTKVHNLFTHKPQEYFYNGISLHGRKEDIPFIHFSDSCACASHPVKEKALYNSLMEFIERQALLGSWLSQTYRYSINPQILPEILPYHELASRLLHNGELFIFQIGNSLPAHTVIIFYFSKSKEDLVQYSIGCSSGLSLKESLLSAFEELYQCYSFLYNMESSGGLENKAGAGYHLEFQKCNSLQIRETIPFLGDIRPFHINRVEDVQQEKQYRFQEVLDELKALSQDIFYYHQYEKGLDIHFTKILSPDFFVHMSLSNNLNIDNSYAKSLNISQENAYKIKIPFP